MATERQAKKRLPAAHPPARPLVSGAFRRPSRLGPDNPPPAARDAAGDPGGGGTGSGDRSDGNRGDGGGTPAVEKLPPQRAGFGELQMAPASTPRRGGSGAARCAGSGSAGTGPPAAAAAAAAAASAAGDAEHTPVGEPAGRQKRPGSGRQTPGRARVVVQSLYPSDGEDADGETPSQKQRVRYLDFLLYGVIETLPSYLSAEGAGPSAYRETIFCSLQDSCTRLVSRCSVSLHLSLLVIKAANFCSWADGSPWFCGKCFNDLLPCLHRQKMKPWTLSFLKMCSSLLQSQNGPGSRRLGLP